MPVSAQPVNRMKHLSVSKIEGFMKCPEQVRLRYLEKLPEMSIGTMVAGRIVHKIIERALKQFILQQRLPEWKEMDDWFEPEWESHVKEEEEKQNFIGWEWKPDDPEKKVKGECRALVPYVRTEFLPSLDPWLIEEGFKFQFDSGNAGTFLVWGYIDLLEKNGVLSDWKTTLEKPSKNQQKLGMQFPGYSWKVRELTGAEVTPCQRIFLCRGDRPRIEVLPFEVEERHRQWFARVAADCWRACQSDSFIPNTSTWVCRPDWCSFYGLCQGELA